MNVVVLVEMATADSAPGPAAALVETCRAGMKGRGTCVVAEAPPQPSATEMYVVAVVTWDGPAHKEARVEIGFREGPRTEWRNRSIAFIPRDPDLERWRTVGFAIATLVGEGLATAAREAGVMPAAKPAPQAAKPAPQATSEAGVEHEPPSPYGIEDREMWIDASASIARGAGTNVPSAGAALDGSVRLVGNWVLQIGAAYAAQNTGVAGLTVRWISGSAGIAGTFPLTASLALEGRLQGYLVNVEGSAPDPATASATASAAASLMGGRAGGGGVWMFSDRFGVVVGADATLTSGTTEFVAHGRPLTKIPPFDASAHAGLRFALY